MDKHRKIIIAVSAGTAAALAMTAAAMMPYTPDGPQRMSGLKVAGLSGYMLRDSDGRDVGKVVDVEVDARGRTRFVQATLNGGETVRIAAFRAQLDKGEKRIDLTVPVAAVVNDPGALIAAAPETATMILASASPAR